MKRSLLKLKLATALLAATVGASAVAASDVAPAGCFQWDSAGCDETLCDSGLCSSDAVCCDNPYGCDAADCGSGFGALGDCLGQCDVLNLLRRSDHCFDDFISPMIDFVHFEDPRTLTELRPIFLTHQFPGTLGPGNVAAGGSVQLFALQFRIALTERLSLIAVKDGYIIDNSEGALDGLLDSGWADVTAGLKYNFLRNVDTGTLASAGFTYEIPMGSEQALQAQGDGEFHLFASAAQRLLDGNAHYMTSFGWQVPVDQDAQSTSVHWLNHFDVRMTKQVYAFTEFSWWHWTDAASAGTAIGVSGQDLINLGDTAVEGNDLVTQNVGLKYKPHGNFEAGAAFEFPLTEFKDIIENRWQFEMIFRY